MPENKNDSKNSEIQKHKFKKSQGSRGKQNKTKKLVMYKEPGIRIISDQKIMNGALPSKCQGKKLLLTQNFIPG